MKKKGFNPAQQMKVVIYQDGIPIHKIRGTPINVKANTTSFFKDKF